MATQGIQGLFGGMGTPEEMQRQLVEQKAMQFATMTPQQQMSYNIYKNTGNLGRGLAGAFGVDVQDPAIKRATMLRQMASQYDTNTVEGLKQYAQALQSVDPEAGMRAMQQAQAMEEQQAKVTLQKTQTDRMAALAEQEKVQADRESKLAAEFNKLPEDATEEDMAKVLRKYGDPKTVFQTMEKKAQIKYQAELAAETKREAIASKEREAQKDRELKSFLASMANAAKQAKGTEIKPLSTGDIKMITEAKTRVADYDYNITKIDDFLTKIEDGKLNFGMLNNLKETVLIGSGKAKEAATNKVAFEQWAKNAVNALLLKAKGTQTEGDAKRAGEQVLSALARNDTEAVKASLQGFKEILDTQRVADKDNLSFIAEERQKPSIANVRAKGTGTKDDPIVLK
jgi:hypothetical protein